MTIVVLYRLFSYSINNLHAFFQVVQPKLQRRRLAFAKHKHVKSRFLKYLKARALGRLLDDHGKPNREVLEKLVHFHFSFLPFALFKYALHVNNFLQKLTTGYFNPSTQMVTHISHILN